MRKGENRQREDDWRELLRYRECLRRNPTYAADFTSGKTPDILSAEWGIPAELLPDPRKRPDIERELRKAMPLKYKSPSPFRPGIRFPNDFAMSALEGVAKTLSPLFNLYRGTKPAIVMTYLGTNKTGSPSGFARILDAGKSITELRDGLESFLETVLRSRRREGFSKRKAQTIRWPRDFWLHLEIWDARKDRKSRLVEIADTFLNRLETGREKAADRYLRVARKFIEKLPITIYRPGTRFGFQQIPTPTPPRVSPSKASKQA